MGEWQWVGAAACLRLAPSPGTRAQGQDSQGSRVLCGPYLCSSSSSSLVIIFLYWFPRSFPGLYLKEKTSPPAERRRGQSWRKGLSAGGLPQTPGPLHLLLVSKGPSRLAGIPPSPPVPAQVLPGLREEVMPLSGPSAQQV